MEKLKPCPFCGGLAKIDRKHEPAGMDGSYVNWIIYCEKCGAMISRPADGFYGRKALTKEEAIEAWNRRTVPTMAQILADILDGTPLLYPCDKLWSPEGWCKDHCKPEQQEPDAECWLKYAEVMVGE